MTNVESKGSKFPTQAAGKKPDVQQPNRIMPNTHNH